MDPRPRYCPERELPPRAYVPGRGSHPSASSDPERPPTAWDGDSRSLRSHPDYRWGVDLYNHGYYWEAHESWESLWSQATRGTAAHMFLQGLIQCAAAALKARMGQSAACRALADRGLAKLHGALNSAGSDHYGGLDLRAFTTDFHGFVELAQSSSDPPQLRLLADS